MKRLLQQVLMAFCFLFLTTASLYAGFVDNGNGTVTDLSTGLMWQQDTPDNGMDWATALSYCEALTLAGHTDWRLPTVKELRSLVNYHIYGPAIDETFFPDTAASWYWSSSTYARTASYAWLVSFNYGFDNYNYKDGSSYVRSVRGGQSGSFGEWIIGTSAGLQQPSMPVQQPLELNVNSSNARGDTAVYQWFVYTTIINGAQSPLYLISDRGTVELTNDVLTYLSYYTFTFDKDNITPISTLSMSNMGLKAGDYFVYGYAYMNASGMLYLDNVVSIYVY